MLCDISVDLFFLILDSFSSTELLPSVWDNMIISFLMSGDFCLEQNDRLIIEITEISVSFVCLLGDDWIILKLLQHRFIVMHETQSPSLGLLQMV